MYTCGLRAWLNSVESEEYWFSPDKFQAIGGAKALMVVLLHPYFLLGGLGLLVLAVFATRTSYVDTPTVAPGKSEILPPLFDEVERARRLGYPLTLTRLIVRPESSTRTLEAATRSIDTIVVHDNVTYLLMPGCTDARSVLDRIPPDANPIVTWSSACFPADALTVGELLLKVGENRQHSRNGHRGSAVVVDRASAR